MKTVIDWAASRGFAQHGWLQTYHTFSFADYFNPQRMHFGALRVLNDDTIAPGEGFGMHPHKNMEVITVPLKGSLKHGDSIDNSRTITPGYIQVMSTGRGIRHSEYNASSIESLELLQIWVIPKKENTEPVYKDYDIRPYLKENEFSLLISPNGDAPASILQDAWFSLGTLEKGLTREYKMHKSGMGVYVFVIGGEIRAGEVLLSPRDGMGIYDAPSFKVEALKGSEVLLMEVPMLI